MATNPPIDLSGDLTVFEYPTYVRYSECGHRGLMTLPALVDAFQDCSTFQSEALGVGMAWLRHEQRAWVLTHWHIVIDRYPSLCESITVGTRAARFRGFTAKRNFYLRDESGTMIARADSSWAFIDLETGRPTRPGPEHVDPYGVHDPLEMPEEPRRVKLPDGLEPCDPVPVRRGLIDTNEHVNNCRYIQIALEALPCEVAPRRVRVDYHRAAVLGDTVHPRVARDGGVIAASLEDAAGSPFAVVELTL